jgi:hypothetical protein
MQHPLNGGHDPVPGHLDSVRVNGGNKCPISWTKGTTCSQGRGPILAARQEFSLTVTDLQFRQDSTKAALILFNMNFGFYLLL